MERSGDETEGSEHPSGEGGHLLDNRGIVDAHRAEGAPAREVETGVQVLGGFQGEDLPCHCEPVDVVDVPLDVFLALEALHGLAAEEPVQLGLRRHDHHAPACGPVPRLHDQGT